MDCCHGASLVRERVQSPALRPLTHAYSRDALITIWAQACNEVLACYPVRRLGIPFSIPSGLSSSMPLMPFFRAKHVGRSTTRYSFEISSLNIERMPCSNLSATGLIVQCRRGPKVASTTTVELTPAMKAAAGGVSFGTQKLSFSATLCAKRLFSTVCPKRERPPQAGAPTVTVNVTVSSHRLTPEGAHKCLILVLATSSQLCKQVGQGEWVL
jgi:hypothetical protein